MLEIKKHQGTVVSLTDECNSLVDEQARTFEAFTKAYEDHDPRMTQDEIKLTLSKMEKLTLNEHTTRQQIQKHELETIKAQQQATSLNRNIAEQVSRLGIHFTEGLNQLCDQS